MKQDKGKGVVIMDKTKYQEKCLAILDKNQFVKLNIDPTKEIKIKIQRVLRKSKKNISSQKYSCLYPTGSSSGKIHGTVKNKEFTKLRAFHAFVLYVSSHLTSLRVFVPYMPSRLTCLLHLRARRAFSLSEPLRVRAFVPHVLYAPPWLRAFESYVPWCLTCFRALCASGTFVLYVPSHLMRLRGFLPSVLTCLCALPAFEPYVPSAPSCRTCLRALRAIAPSRLLRYSLF